MPFATWRSVREGIMGDDGRMYLRLADGRDAVLLQNQDPWATQWATVRFAPRLNVPRNASGVLEVDPVHATLAPLLDDSPLEPGVQLGLRPGMARLLVAAARL